jgi:hypothetical protein
MPKFPQLPLLDNAAQLSSYHQLVDFRIAMADLRNNSSNGDPLAAP